MNVLTPFSSLYTREQARRAPTDWDIDGLDHLCVISPETPIIFVYSHKRHTPRAQETRALCRAALLAQPDAPRIVEHVVRPHRNHFALRIRQALSIAHHVILTPEESANQQRRNKHNMRVFREFARRVKSSGHSYAITIAPDGGRTKYDSPFAVDPEKAQSGGVGMIINSLNRVGVANIAIIPVKFDGPGRHIRIGADFYREFIATGDRTEQARLLAVRINEA